MPDRHDVTISIHGTFDRPAEEVAQVIDQALCAAGLCGCDGPENGYTMSAKEEGERRDIPSHVLLAGLVLATACGLVALWVGASLFVGAPPWR